VDEMIVLVGGKKKTMDSGQENHGDQFESKVESSNGTPVETVHPVPLTRNPNEIGPGEQIHFDGDDPGEETRRS
jgi:hypothetical protein